MSDDGCPTDGLHAHFDAFIESAVVGLRKPDPRIYELVCRELRVERPRAAFLDDIGRNLKPARALGMATIKVNDPDQALRDLSALLGIELG
ncbi:MAG: HAD-IA family hydrolase [Candidatus Rokubacteria bacterium]|nr:HAD-IA family hydrolase [Candidatus Rokubacteria bacterium]